jgi:RNA polymerase sigma-70 factor (ECF subfamily)
VSRRIGTFEGRARFSTWLYQVATNASLDTYRKLKRRGSQLSTELEERPSPERTSVVAGTRVDLFEALEQLDPRFGEPVVMRDVFGLDYGEIARQLGIPEGTVKSRIHEGRKSLRWLLER